jgi:hypothetical protein
MRSGWLSSSSSQTGRFVPQRHHDGVGDDRRDPPAGPRPPPRRTRTVRRMCPTVGVATVSGRSPGFPVHPGGRIAGRPVGWFPPSAGRSRVLPLGLWVRRGSATLPLKQVGACSTGCAPLGGWRRGHGTGGTERFPGGLSRDCHPASEGDRAISPEVVRVGHTKAGGRTGPLVSQHIPGDRFALAARRVVPPVRRAVSRQTGSPCRAEQPAAYSRSRSVGASRTPARVPAGHTPPGD